MHFDRLNIDSLYKQEKQQKAPETDFKKNRSRMKIAIFPPYYIVR